MTYWNIQQPAGDLQAVLFSFSMICMCALQRELLYIMWRDKLVWQKGHSFRNFLHYISESISGSKSYRGKNPICRHETFITNNLLDSQLETISGGRDLMMGQVGMEHLEATIYIHFMTVSLLPTLRWTVVWGRQYPIFINGVFIYTLSFLQGAQGVTHGSFHSFLLITTYWGRWGW